MDEQAFGQLNLFYSFIPVVATLTSLGLEQTLRRFQPEYLQAGRTALAAWLVRFVSTARFATSVFAVGIVVLAWNLVAPYFDLTAYRVDFAIFGILIILYFQSTILQLSLASHMLHRFSVGSAAALGICKLAAYLAISYYGTLTLRAAIVADIVAYGTVCLLLLIAHWRLAAGPSRSKVSLEPGERRRLARYGTLSHLNDVGSLLCYPQTDNFFVGGMMGPLAVATYAFYNRLTEMINNLMPIRLFENVVHPLFFAVPRGEAEARIPRYFTLLININLALQLPVIAFSLVYHREIVELFFGSKYVMDSAIFPLVAGAAAISTVLAIPVTLVAQYYERPSVILASELFGLYQIGAMLVLVPVLGLYGAALSSGSFHLFRNLFVWWRMRRHARWLNPGAVLAMSLLVWSPIVLACMTLRETFALSSVVDLAVGASLCAFGTLVYARSGAISSSDRDILANVMHGREARLLRWLGLAPR
jgi:O-antigen/teichoic acid export membrane protein